MFLRFCLLFSILFSYQFMLHVQPTLCHWPPTIRQTSCKSVHATNASLLDGLPIFTGLCLLLVGNVRRVQPSQDTVSVGVHAIHATGIDPGRCFDSAASLTRVYSCIELGVSLSEFLSVVDENVPKCAKCMCQTSHENKNMCQITRTPTLEEVQVSSWNLLSISASSAVALDFRTRSFSLFLAAYEHQWQLMANRAKACIANTGNSKIILRNIPLQQSTTAFSHRKPHQTLYFTALAALCRTFLPPMKESTMSSMCSMSGNSKAFFVEILFSFTLLGNGSKTKSDIRTLGQHGTAAQSDLFCGAGAVPGGASWKDLFYVLCGVVVLLS